MKKFLFMTAAALCLLTVSASAQSEDEDEVRPFSTKHTFGVTASSTSGSGIFYKNAITPDYHVKLAGFIYFNESSNNNDVAYSSNGNDFFRYNAGIEFQRSLYSTRTTRFYALAGVNYWYDRDGNSSPVRTPGTDTYVYYDYKNIEKTIRGGVGIGFEIVAWRHLSFNIDGAVNFYNTDKEYITTAPSEPNSTGYDRGVHIGGGIGIGYTF